MQITYDKLGELTGLNKNIIRVYMSSYKLTKYLTMHLSRKPTRPYILTVVFNQDFINDFSEYLKLKLRDSESFKQKAAELLNKHRK